MMTVSEGPIAVLLPFANMVTVQAPSLSTAPGTTVAPLAETAVQG